jgi:CheY-like chemotaxis protein
MNTLNTFVIEDNSTKLAQTLGLKAVEFTANLLTDDAIDEWLATTVFGINSNIQKLIIPIRLGNDDPDYIGLRVGLHIRLSRSLGNKRFIPLVFASVGEPKELIIGNQIERKSLLSAILLFTKGCTIVDIFDLEHAVADFDEVIDKDILQNDLLKKLVISDERLQGHQLANEWGALRLAKFAGIELTTIKQPKDLYFKYRFSLSDLEIDSKGKNKTNIHSNKDCSYLLIDDNALNGWEELLTHIINSEIINKFTKKTLSKSLTTFEEAVTYEDYESHDLIFLDLRLTKEEDNSKNLIQIGDYSGVKLLNNIKEINKGIQVIILTASNKAWNMKALLDAGADGYFIKESPDMPVSDDVSKANYENLVISIKKGLGKGYLKEIYKIHKKAIDFIDLDYPSKAIGYQRFYDRTKSSLDIAFELLNYASKDQKYFNFAYLTYYQILEDYANQKENFDFVSNVECYVDNRTERVICKHSDTEAEWSLKFERDKSNGDYFKHGNEIKEFEKVTVGSLAKISFLLTFKFNMDEDTLKTWGKINALRNTKAAHGGGSYVSVTDVKEMLGVVKLFLTNP